MDWYPIIQKILFQFPAEQAHEITLGLLSRFPNWLPAHNRQMAKSISREYFICGLPVMNRIGLAAGMDKNAECLLAWKRLGFGFVEIGTVTPLPQLGNPRPRLFRLKNDLALINRMGFNNKGMHFVAERLAHRPDGLVVGANIGKNKDTPNENAFDDYSKCLRTLQPHCDYITINISSPNTPGLRELQNEETILKLLSDLQHINQGLAIPLPIFVKVAPDLDASQVATIAKSVVKAQFTGVIATNTTIARTGLSCSQKEILDYGAGGLSGKPLTHQSTNITQMFVNEGIDVISVGGIMNANDAKERFKLGAKLVQTYTGFVYGGPTWLQNMIAETAFHNFSQN